MELVNLVDAGEIDMAQSFAHPSRFKAIYAGRPWRLSPTG
jgi:hypothetical protein